MNTIIEFFQGLAAQVPDLLQPLIIAAAGAIPFIEGEVSSVIGVWAGLNPIVAGLAGAIGNFICVAVIVLLGARARRAVVARRDQKRATARSVVTPSGDTIAEAGPSDIRTADHLGAGDDLHPDLNPDLDSDLHSDTHPDLHSDLHSDTDSDTDEALTATTEKPDSKGRIKFKRFLTRFGVPGGEPARAAGDSDPDHLDYPRQRWSEDLLDPAVAGHRDRGLDDPDHGHRYGSTDTDRRLSRPRRREES